MAKKYYAVRVGKTPGIYLTWDDCKAMTSGYPGAVFKSFTSEEEAKAFLEGVEASKKVETFDAQDLKEPYAFVDGSFNSATKVYGYGGFLVENGCKHEIQGSGNAPHLVEMHNVSGELAGSMAAIEKAIELGLKEINIYYDYMGIEMWATGAWKRNKEGTIAYYNFIQFMRGMIQINFIKVPGHAGIEGNEIADKMARKAAGVDV